MILSREQAYRLIRHLVAGPDPEPAEQPRLPQQVGPYRIVGIIGDGGMGTVYEARQERPDRPVAVKVMKRGVAAPGAQRRFEFEVVALGRLHHPAIAQIYAAGTWEDPEGPGGGVPFFAMEYVPGARTITRYAGDEGLTVRRRLELFARVCDGVHHGHQNFIVHRDLKPANILIDREGNPKIIDFGVARATDTDIALTTLRTGVGELLGTLQYMSPEQCEADPLRLDTRTDVYSLGAILYELVCGQLPYDVSGKTIAGAARIIQEAEPVRPVAVRRSLRGDVDAIVTKAIHKDPEKRFQSVSEMAVAIRRHLDGQPTGIRPPSAWARLMTWITRHPVVTTAAACLILVATTLSALSFSVWWLGLRPHHIELTPDRSVARLVSVSGRIIHTWTAGEPDGISFARLLERPAALGGGHVAVIAHNCTAGSNGARWLDAYGLDNLDYPIWRRRITDDDLRRAGLSDRYAESQFHPEWAEAIDVFPQRPGTEIAVIHKDGPFSAVAFRIYDLAGEVLFQFWHDGAINPGWLLDGPELVFCGLNSRHPWARRGHPDIREVDPTVVFAVRPEIGRIETQWIDESQRPVQPPLAWYRCLLPAESSDIFSGMMFIAPHPQEAGSRLVRFAVGLRADSDARVSWLIEDGRFVEGSAVPNGAYRRLLEQGADPAADPDRFHLGELPAPVTKP